MPLSPDEPVFWPWLTAAGLGAFHGLNPAMGWLFAVALALQRESRRVLVLALLPIAAGHALAVALTAGAALALGAVMNAAWLARLCGGLLLAWAVVLTLRGDRAHLRVEMTTGMAGLAGWSFLMALSHGAGVMLLPALLPVAMPKTAANMPAAGQAMDAGAAITMVGLHSAAMLAMTGAAAFLAHEIAGRAFLRRGWINLDWLWRLALAGAGLWLLLE